MNFNKGILHEKNEFTNVRQLVEWAADKYDKKTAYSYKTTPISENIKISFAQLRDDTRALASEMLSMGCQGKHIALIGKLSYEWILVYFATLSIGAVIVPLDRDWQGEELASTCEFADVNFLFCDGDISDKAEIISKNIKLSSNYILLGKNDENSVSNLIKSGKKKYNANPEKYFEAVINPVSTSLLVFTSGTTGKGKGVMLSQTAILSCMSDVIPYIDFSEKTVAVLPPHHTYGSTVMLIGHVMIGSEVFISSGIRYIQKELKEQKPGHMVLVPLFLEKFYRKILSTIKDQGKEKLVNSLIKTSNAMRKVGIDQRQRLFATIRNAFGGELKTVITGGAAISPEILHFFDSIGISVLNGYGITECAPLISVNRSKNIVEGSVGNVLDMDTVKIDSPNENGEGEILVKGSNVMLGYYKNKEATADAFKNGYFRTGDYGKLDKNGILYITGRKKNLIILSNGKNVYPEEIEAELSAIDGVCDIVVYEGQSKRGISHNAIVAEVYPDTEFFEKMGISDINAYFRPHIDEYNKKAVTYKRISLLRIRESEFPKNTLRKILRFKIDMTID